jgi:hypothetical protein
MKDILPQEQTSFVESGLAADEELDAVFQLAPRATAGGDKQETENKTTLFHPTPIGVYGLAHFLLLHLHLWPVIVPQRKTNFEKHSNSKRQLSNTQLSDWPFAF